MLLAGFAFIPAMLRPGIPVWRLKELPARIAWDLNLRGCNIVRGAGVVSGNFDGIGGTDWAVLCQQGNQSSLFLYTDASSQAAVFSTHPSGLTGDPESARGIRAVGWSYALQHNPGFQNAAGPSSCIEDGVGMGSTLYCRLDGRWVGLAGAD